MEAAREGDAHAAHNYAHCLRFGIGTPTDAERAKSFYSYAKEADEGEALYNLSVMYMHAEGVPKNYKKAFELMRHSAERGCIEAQLYLGMAYTTGMIYEPDIIGISRIPAHEPIYRSSDSMLLSGDIEGFEEDDEARCTVLMADAREAFLWFQRAARHERTYVEDLVLKGQFLYAKCYVDGLGTEPDPKKAVRLMLAAGKNGSADAIDFLTANGCRPDLLLSGKRKK